MKKQTMAIFASLVALMNGFAHRVDAAEMQNGLPDAAFAASLYHQLATTKGNLLFSPFSIRTAVGMTVAGAAGNTASQIKTTLGFAADATNVDRQIGAAAKTLNQPQTGYTLAIANALWAEKTFPFDSAFTNSLVDRFDANLHQTDFIGDPETARADINRWVGKHTAGKITDLFPPRSIDKTTALVLANAVYLKAKWQQPFKASMTAPMPFHLDASIDIKTATMSRTLGEVPYAETGDVQLVDLPYTAEQLSMTLVVPKAIDGLTKLEPTLDGATITKWLASMKPADVRLSLPKIKLVDSFQLSDTLAAMGMPDAFDRHAANFTGMVAKGQPSPGPLFIGRVFHRAMADVDEEGTEAAAATGIGMVTGAAMRRPKPVMEVTADRPFLLMIRHRGTGAILFMGRVSDPR